MKLVSIRIAENDLVVIDKLADESNLSRSDYIRLSALNRRTRSVVKVPVVDYTFLSKISSLTNLILISARAGEDTVLDIKELKELIDQRLSSCLEN
jgi:hypothetical protein